MINCNQVSKRYNNGFDALQRITFSLGKGDMAFLTGPSGAGKSTLLKLLAHLETPTGGHITVADQNYDELTPSKIPFLRRDIGIIFQTPYLLTERNVFANVALPLEVIGCGHREIQRRVRAALDKVGLLSKEKQLPQSLSTGEQQRVGIARAVVSKPKVLLADEPTGNLDPELSKEIMQLFFEFSRVGVTALVASHDIHLISEFNRPILQLQAGRLKELS